MHSLSTKFRYREVFQREDESDPKIWGPAKWNQMFNFASMYPKKNPNEDQKLEAYIFFKTLDLPCFRCEQSYKLFWNQLPIEDYLTSRLLLIEWVYNIKKKVNKKLMQEEKNNEAKFTGECLKQNPNQMSYCVNYGKKRQKFQTKKSPLLQIVLDQYYNMY